MIKKVIALVFVSFFVMSGLTILTENNQNYNISSNNVNSFTSSSFNPYRFSINKSITYTSGISSGGQTFGCYDNSLYYIYGDSITKFDFKNNNISTFISLTSQPKQLEIYNNFMIIGYGSGNTATSSTLINIYNFSNSILYTLTLSDSYNYFQFAISNNISYIAGLSSNCHIYLYSINLGDSSISLIDTLSMGQFGNQLSVIGDNNNLIFATTDTADALLQFAYVNILLKTFNTSIGGNSNFANINSIIDLGNCGILGTQSYYITDKNTGGTTQYSYNPYDSGLFFADSNYINSFIPMNITNYVFTKLPVLVNNSNYQEFCNNGKIVPVYLPIGSGNTIFNSLTYIIKGNSNLIIVNNNNVYVYPLFTYILNVKSYNKFNNQIQDYFSMNGTIYTGYSNSIIVSNLPNILIPLNTSTYYYNNSVISIIQSDFTGSGSNLYYNLSIYYNQIQPPSIPLYDIFTYMYPISIIGLFVGMGAFVFAIKKRGYKI